LKSFKDRYNNYSNFTKINNNYVTYVFRQIEFEYRSGISSSDMELLESILYPASDEEKQRDAALLEKYVNVVYVDVDSNSGVSESVASQIKEALVAYRTKTYKLNRIKAYEVFRNASCDRISKYAPTTIEELKELRCLDEAQLTLYGQDIIEIVKDCMR
jgi:superfamily II DNA helicase RecQ